MLNKFLIISFLSLQLFAGTTGSLEGIVTDKQSRDALIGTTVMIKGLNRGTVTNIDGYYAINNIPAGTYDVVVSYIGYQTTIVKDVQIRSDLKTKLDLRLVPSTVELTAMEVTAERPPIQKDVTGTTYISNEESFKTLPVSTVSDVVGLQPGVTMENNIRGGKTSEVVYLVDGLPVQNLIEGGAGADLPQSSITELSVQTGGFDPEYGNALSGVINIVTKRGEEKHRFALRLDKDDLFGGKQVDHRNEIDLFASGPVAGSLFYFASVNGIYSDTRWWQDLRNFFDSPYSRSYSGFGKLDYLFSSSLRLSMQTLYSYKQYRDYEYTWRFNLDGLPKRSEEAYRYAGIVSHTLSENLFYTVSFSRYTVNSSIGETSKGTVDTSLYQWDFFLRYIVDGNRSWWADRQQIHNLVKADMTWRMNTHHMIKFGGEVNFQEIYSDVVRYEPTINIFGKPFVNKPLLNYSTDFRYFPRMGSAYAQDKIELSKDGMLLNLGVRYEFLDPRAERPVAERVQASNNIYETKIVGSVPAKVKQLFSPRIGFAAPFAVNGYLFINYGTYYQFPLFDFLYSGLNNVSLKKGSGVLVGNPDLKPEETRSWEMSIKFSLASGVVLSGTYFHKETMNQIDVKTFVPTNSSVAGDYGFAEFVNNPFAKSSGIELMAVKDRGTFLTGSISYTFMTAEGVSENARGGLQYYQWGFPVPAKLYPLSWDQRHAVKLISVFELPMDFRLSASWVFRTGRPYTYFPSGDGFTPADPNQTFEPNNARMKGFSLLNVKASWAAKLSLVEESPILFTVYLDMRNILNTKNVKWVDSAGRIGGELSDLSAYEQYRRIRLGLKLEL
jgi:outer membrane receptor for ferrienterochelin and colicin